MITIKCRRCGGVFDVGAIGASKICRECGASLPAELNEAKQADMAYGELPGALAALENTGAVNIAWISAAEKLHRKCSKLVERLVKYQSFYKADSNRFQADCNRLKEKTTGLYSNIQDAKQREAERLQEEEMRRQQIKKLQEERTTEVIRQLEEEGTLQKNRKKVAQIRASSIALIICIIIGHVVGSSLRFGYSGIIGASVGAVIGIIIIVTGIFGGPRGGAGIGAKIGTILGVIIGPILGGINGGGSNVFVGVFGGPIVGVILGVILGAIHGTGAIIGAIGSGIISGIFICFEGGTGNEWVGNLIFAYAVFGAIPGAIIGAISRAIGWAIGRPR